MVKCPKCGKRMVVVDGGERWGVLELQCSDTDESGDVGCLGERSIDLRKAVGKWPAAIV